MFFYAFPTASPLVQHLVSSVTHMGGALVVSQEQQLVEKEERGEGEAQQRHQQGNPYRR